MLDKCIYIRDYALFVYTVRKYQEAKYSIDDAVYKAVKECIANGVMVDFLKEYESEVKNMLLRKAMQKKKFKMQRISKWKALHWRL